MIAAPQMECSWDEQKEKVLVSCFLKDCRKQNCNGNSKGSFNRKGNKGQLQLMSGDFLIYLK